MCNPGDGRRRRSRSLLDPSSVSCTSRFSLAFASVRSCYTFVKNVLKPRIPQRGSAWGCTTVLPGFSRGIERPCINPVFFWRERWVCSPKRRNPDAILPSAVIFQHLMSQRLRILNIVGARPNLPKIAPLIREMQRHPDIEPILVHTGQHYDEKLSDIFFRQMGIPSPQVNLEVGSGTHASQTAEILKRIEPVLLERKPHLVLVVGDVNSTVAVSLAAVKLGIPVAHVEAGLRSFDRSMPEEINRIL